MITPLDSPLLFPIMTFMCKQMTANQIIRFLSIIIFVLFLYGCRFITPAGSPLIPDPPAPVQTSANISNLVISPGEVQAGQSTEVHFAFNYEDLDADVGPEEAVVEIQTRVLSGNITINSTPAQLTGLVQQDAAQWGRQGMVTLSRTFHVPASAIGTLEVSVTLLDGENQRSNVITEELPIKSLTDGGGGVGGGQCAILNGNKEPTSSARIGRQVFFRVIDPDNNISTQNQDAIYLSASFRSGATGDYETIGWLLETGSNTGVFEGPPGGMTLTSTYPKPNDGVLSVIDHGTVVAFYKDPNSHGDICIALAKVR